MKFKLKGLKIVERQFKNLERDNEKAINKGIQQTARLILNSALSRVPSINGHLKSTLGQEDIPEEMKVKVFASALYAAYVEFGTGDFVEVPNGLEEYAMEFFVNGLGKGHPHPFLFNSMADHQDQLLPLIEAELKKIIK